MKKVRCIDCRYFIAFGGKGADEHNKKYRCCEYSMKTKPIGNEQQCKHFTILQEGGKNE